jgi:hypothetical protein
MMKVTSLKKNIKLNFLNLNKIEKAYLSLNVLLAFERKTSAVSNIHALPTYGEQWR